TGSDDIWLRAASLKEALPGDSGIVFKALLEARNTLPAALEAAEGAELLRNLGVAYRQRGDVSAAIAALEEAKALQTRLNVLRTADGA
ncbi:unnamed protein product, partial [Polarella glacialis]